HTEHGSGAFSVGRASSDDIAILVGFAGSTGFRATSADLLQGKQSSASHESDLSKARANLGELPDQGFEQSPWMQARALSGAEGADRMTVEYANLVDQLADLWRFPMLRLPARPKSYEERTDALTKWAMAPAT